ncbi:CHRD domain-containing protein [Chitinophaga sp. Cy-1792]|uniref:CHRD domain-containing protein n=1 Tax=Chitinophaga sp. Cy-1792 TaxID=2608339 RepID=UPI001423B45F|nr:CHRD domain-containing protein [Chitinophaga sp. Cy-1792]
MRLNSVFIFGMLLLAACTMVGCKKDPKSDQFVLKFWNVQLKGTNVVPATPGNGASAYALLYLRDDYHLYYDIYFDSLPAGIVPEGVDIRVGGPVQNNSTTLLSLTGTFTGSKMSGNIDMPKTMVDSLLKTSGYMVIKSKTAPDGLVRGQLDKKIIFSKDVAMTAAQVVPAANNSATANFSIRITEDNIGFYAIDVKNLPAGDALTETHIHTSAGATLLKMASKPADYGVQLNMSITGEPLRALQQDPLYVDVHSTLYPNGLVRGTLR